MIHIIGDRGSGKTMNAVMTALIESSASSNTKNKCLILSESREYIEDMVKNFFKAEGKVEVRSALLLCKSSAATEKYDYEIPFIIDELDIFNNTLRKVIKEVGADYFRINHIKDLIKEYLVGYTAYSADAFQELLDILEIEREQLKHYIKGYNRRYNLSYRN